MKDIKNKQNITNWWLAKKGNLLTFANIFNLTNKDEIVVVGISRQKNEFGESVILKNVNPVVKITSTGVMTCQGEYYFFDEASVQYKAFLIEANKPDVFVAYSWRKNNYGRICAEYVVSKKITKDHLIMEFETIDTKYGLSIGYSKALKSNVVLAPFSISATSINVGINSCTDEVSIEYTMSAKDQEAFEKLFINETITFKKGWLM